MVIWISNWGGDLLAMPAKLRLSGKLKRIESKFFFGGSL